MGGAYPHSSLVSLMVPINEQILWLAFALAWGTEHLLVIRSPLGLVDDIESVTSEENTWGFGQLFPVILLALPIFSIAESYYGRGTRFAIIILGIWDRSRSHGTLLVRS